MSLKPKKQRKTKTISSHTKAQNISKENSFTAENSVRSLLEKLKTSSYDERDDIRKTLSLESHRIQRQIKKHYDLTQEDTERLYEVVNIYNSGVLAAEVVELLRNDKVQVHDNYGFYQLKKVKADEEEIKIKIEVVADPPIDNMPDSDDDNYEEDQAYVDHYSMVDEIAVAVSKMAKITPDEVETEFDYDYVSGHMIIELEFPARQTTRRKYWRME